MTVIHKQVLQTSGGRIGARATPRIPKTTLGPVGLAVGVGVGFCLLRTDVPAGRRMGSRARLERAALDFVSDRPRDSRRFELPSSFCSAARDTEDAFVRVLRRRRDGPLPNRTRRQALRARPARAKQLG